ncbi:MAG: S46 family peptidase [Salinivirgaceae bacterium]|nr:S46 family peptidase [Salinivirgaceae bacterium]
MKRLIVSLLGIFVALTIRANEGMWLPFLLENNIGEMSEMGLHLTAEDIYSINQSCLKDAVVGFVDLDRPFHHFCSGSVISAQGLVITNHHCGLDVVQQHSSLQNDYITNGFWAMNQSDELGGNKIGVCFLRRMEDVTAQVLDGVNDTMPSDKRSILISNNISKIEQAASTDSTLKAHVDAFYCSNEYYLSVYEIFEDIRLVGAPPISIGKFGGDTDNWVWPRHTGDFTIFRIYADSLNRPAPYSIENVPYRASNYLKINAKEKHENDFVMLMGYPGTTNEYLPSFAVEATQDVFDPIVVEIRGKSIDIIKERMRNDQSVMIKYTSKVASLANAWKKLQGERNGLKNKHVVDQKREREKQMLAWIAESDERKQLYDNLLDDYEADYIEYVKHNRAWLLMSETIYKSEALTVCRKIKTLINENMEDSLRRAQILDYLNEFYADYDSETDISVTQMLINEYLANAQPEHVPATLKKWNNTASFAAAYHKSMFTTPSTAISFFEKHSVVNEKTLLKDPLYKLASETNDIYNTKISKPLSQIQRKNNHHQRRFMQLQRECFADKRFFPDANSTFRVTYGQIRGFRPSDAVVYGPFTTLGGVMEKCDMDIYDYTVPDRLKQLFAANDFGTYCNADGTMPVGFITTCHTTGGNSGSPIFDADGNLIGLNFDRVWEGTMSDLQFDADICRNIGLDIRYALFIIDKYAGAQRLIDEMEIIGN